MASESMQSTIDEIKDAKNQLNSLIEGKNLQIQGLELQVRALRAELEAMAEYYSGINSLLDRLSLVKGAAQQQRVAIEILELRNRKKGLKKVERSTE